MSCKTRTDNSQRDKRLDQVGVIDNKRFSCKNLRKILRVAGPTIGHLSVNLFFSILTVISLFLVTVRQLIEEEPELEDNFAYANAFVIANLCYKVGQFIARSSLPFIKIDQLWYMTLF